MLPFYPKWMTFIFQIYGTYKQSQRCFLLDKNIEFDSRLTLPRVPLGDFFLRRNGDTTWSPFRLQRSSTNVPEGTLYHPSPMLVSELWWPASTNLDTASTFSFVGLYNDESVQPKYETRRQAGWNVYTGFLTNVLVQDG